MGEGKTYELGEFSKSYFEIPEVFDNYEEKAIWRLYEADGVSYEPVYDDNKENLLYWEVHTIIGGLYSGSNQKSMVIKDTIEGMSVKRISSIYLTNLQSVTIPTSIVEIEGWAFDHCNNLTDIYYKGTKPDWENIQKGENWLPNGKSVTLHFSDNTQETLNS